jgi:hypothetical protein
MTALSEISKADAIAAMQRAKATVRRMRAGSESIVRRSVCGVLTVAGGVSDGAVRGFWGDAQGQVNIPGTEIDFPATLGSVLSAGAAFGLAGEASDYLAAYGFGMLSAVSSRETEQAIKGAAVPKKK